MLYKSAQMEEDYYGNHTLVMSQEEPYKWAVQTNHYKRLLPVKLLW